MKKEIGLVMMLSLCSTASAQKPGKGQLYWDNTNHEVFAELGATQFLGDLGGRNAIGSTLSIRDIDWKSTGFNAGLGYRRNLKGIWSTSTRLSIGRVKGDDLHTDEFYRRKRNLHFRSILVDLSQRMEMTMISSKLLRRGHKAKHLEYVRNGDFEVYSFVGVGVTYFDPEARHNGTWVKLKPLRTEGQGLEGGPKEYSRFTVSIPAGLGMRFRVSKRMKLGIEATYVKTFSDYIDDVHGVFFNPQKIEEVAGEAAAYLSNPSVAGSNPYRPGDQRGGKGNDAYFYTNFTISYAF